MKDKQEGSDLDAVACGTIIEQAFALVNDLSAL
jgi:hypothetical protein